MISHGGNMATGPTDQINPQTIIKLFAQILECCENDKGKQPFITVLSDELMMVEFEDQRFRVYVQDIKRFQ